MDTNRIGSRLLLTLVGVSLGSTHPARGQFRVPPYLQHPTPQAISIVWWSPDAAAGTLEWGRTTRYDNQTVSHPQPEPAISTVINGVEHRAQRPYRHELRLSGLEANTAYFYRVTQGTAAWAAQFTTAPGPRTDITFAVAADPESKATEPQRSRIHRALLEHMRTHAPRFLVYAGDLVDQGNAQDDWDSFWSDLLRASPADSLASTVPVYAALGNHDYSGQNTTLGANHSPYTQPYAEAGVARFRAYFTFPPNDHPPDDPRQERYYSFKYGPVSIIVLDTNNDSLSTDNPDTNWDTGRWKSHPLVGENEPPEPGGQSFAPDIHGGVSTANDSRQYQWLVRTLRQAAAESAFIFVVNHQAPYSSFVHGDPHERQSGHPLRKLDRLFHAHGVAAVFSGHDESYERSITTADPSDSDQPQRNNEIHYYVLPTIGDPTGLRTPVPNPTWQQGHRRFIYPLDQRRHGYLTIQIEHLPPDKYRATVTPRYHDPADPTNPNLFYDDVVRITRRAPDSHP